MSITLLQKKEGELYGEIRIDKDSALYLVSIHFHGRRIYANSFCTMKNAKQALNRNMKKYL